MNEINKMPEFYTYTRKMNKIPAISAPKMPKFYMIIAQKYFSRIFFWGGGVPPVPSPSPMPMATSDMNKTKVSRPRPRPQNLRPIEIKLLDVNTKNDDSNY